MLKPPGCSQSTGSPSPIEMSVPMTGSGWKEEEGLLAWDLADDEAGLCFCPSVNHPAWFAELKRGKTETTSYYYGCHEADHRRDSQCCCRI